MCGRQKTAITAEIVSEAALAANKRCRRAGMRCVSALLEMVIGISVLAGWTWITGLAITIGWWAG